MDDSVDDEEVVVALLVEDDEEVVIDVVHEESAIIELDPRSDVSTSSLSVLDSYESAEVRSDIDPRSDEQDDVVVTTFVQRRAQSFRSRNRSYSKKTLTFGLLSIVTVITIATLSALESPAYDVDTISIVNKSSLPFSHIENERMRSYTDTLKSDPLYRVQTDSVRNDLKTILTIQSVQIEKKWPSTLVVTITRRSPRAYIETDRGVVLVDSDGVIYQRANTPPKDLPVFDGIDEVTFGTQLRDDTYIDVLDAAPKEIKNQIARVARDDNNYVAELSDGIDIVLGDSRQLKEKLAIAWSILNTKKRSELGYIDVSVPSLPVSGSPQLKV